MSMYIGINLDMSSYPDEPGTLWIHVVKTSGAKPERVKVDVPFVKLDESAADADWVRDALVAAIEAI